MINAMNHALAVTHAGDVDNGITGRVRAWFMADQAFAGDVVNHTLAGGFQY